MKPFEDFQKHAMREAMGHVYSWKQEHPEEYSHFSVEMMKMVRNDFSCLERIFKMAVGFVPVYVLVECRKLLVSDSDEVLSADKRVATASRVVDELMRLRGYLRFGVYTETVGEKDTQGPSEQFLVREFSLADEDQSEEDDEHIYIPSVTAQEFWESLPSFVQMGQYSLLERDILLMNLRLCQRESCCPPYKRCQRFSSNFVSKFILVAIPY